MLNDLIEDTRNLFSDFRNRGVCVYDL